MSEAEAGSAPPQLGLLTLAIIVIAGVFALAAFVGWVYGHQAIKTEKRIHAALTPDEKAEMELEAAGLQKGIANLTQQIKSIRPGIADAKSEVQKVASALEESQRRKGDLDKARADFVDFLRKVELQPSDVGIQGL